MLHFIWDFTNKNTQLTLALDMRMLGNNPMMLTRFPHCLQCSAHWFAFKFIFWNSFGFYY